MSKHPRVDAKASENPRTEKKHKTESEIRSAKRQAVAASAESIVTKAKEELAAAEAKVIRANAWAETTADMAKSAAKTAATAAGAVEKAKKNVAAAEIHATATAKASAHAISVVMTENLPNIIGTSSDST